MAYYIISKYVNDGKLKAKNLTESFFDYVLLAKGDLKKASKEAKISAALLRKIRKDFEYWYPVDWRNSGKDLVSNHLLYYLYNHIAIFPRKYWPKAISVNGWVKIEGQKMAKSTGRAITFKTGMEKYGADVIRTVVSTTASPEQDSDFRENEAENVLRWKQRFYNTILEISKVKTTAGKQSNLDRWLQSRVAQAIKTVTDNLEVLNTREAAQVCLYQLASDVKWYLRRSAGAVSKVAKDVASDWVKMVSVYMPHIAEELWFKLGNKGFISAASWPKHNAKMIDKKAEQVEESIKKVVEDVNHIKSIIKKTPERIYLYTIPSELKVYAEAENFFGKEFRAKVKIFAVNDKDKYDPENKASKAKPGKPAIYLE